MITHVLVVIFENEDQGIVLVLARGDLFHEQSYSIVVVRHLRIRRVHTVNSGGETPKVVMRKADELQRRQVAVRYELIEFSLPLLKPPIVGILLVVAAEVGI